MFRRLLSFLIAFVLIVAFFPFASTNVFAISYDKPNTHTNTGDQRYDIVQIALTQKGYYEGEGNNNDTKYGERLGINYLGWCGAFVSWCAIEAGIPDSILTKTGVAKPGAFGLTQQPSGYVPKSGDLFFAKDYSHVGLVWYVDGEYIVTIEGNTWDSSNRHGVYVQRKLISNHYFASPNYRGGGEHKYVLGTEDAHPHKEFYKCNSCTDMYYTGKTTTVSGCKECQQALCSHSYSGWSTLNNNDHSRVCKKCEKIETKTHTWDSGTVTKEATCNAAGSKIQKCTGCALEKTVTIPKTGVHVYSSWVKSNDRNHSRKCTSCNLQQNEAHKISTEWSTNEKQHWYSCLECMEQFQVADHQMGELCDSPCKICNYVNPDGHNYGDGWKVDATGHWRVCSKCDFKTEQEAHAFTADCDETCDTCGFTRQTVHAFQDTYSTNEENHWFECTGCGLKKDDHPHQPDDTSREGVMQYCTVCQLQLVSDSAHTHAYDELQKDSRYHWGVCSCGLEMPNESHTWSIQSGTCSVCQTPYVEQEANEYNDLLPWILGGAGILLLIIGMIVVAIVIRKKD